jgi:hypothetical protein
MEFSNRALAALKQLLDPVTTRDSLDPLLRDAIENSAEQIF